MTEIPIERIVFLLFVLKGVLCLPQFRRHHDEPRYVQGPTFHWSQQHNRHPDRSLHEMCRDVFLRDPSITQEVKVSNENNFQPPTVIPKKTQSPPPPVIGLQIFPVSPSAGQMETNTNMMCTEDQLLNHRNHKESGTCQRLGARGICGVLMNFYAEDDNVTGYCDCKNFEGNSLRPIVYWPSTDRCYHLYEQGPCSAGKWLIQMGSNPPICTKRSCPQNTDGDEAKYWFIHLGMCYQTDTLNEDTAEFCKSKTLKLYHTDKYIDNDNLGYLRCLDKPPLPTLRALVAGAKDLPCKPGHKKSLNGECSRIAKFI